MKNIITKSMKENLIATPEKPLTPTTVMISLTYKCQCKCEHCGVDFRKIDGEKELNQDEIRKIITDCSKMGAYSFYFFGGEPLLIPELFEYIKLAKSFGVKSSVDTNGLLLTKDYAKKLKEAQLNGIRVSIDSPYEEEHDKHRGIKGIFKKALEGLDYCREYGIKTFISAYATKENLRNGDLKKIIEIAKQHGSKVRLLSSICSGRWQNDEKVVLSDEELSMLKALLEKDTVFWESTDSKDSPFYCMSMAKELFHITPYGEVQPCCYFPSTIGNIRQEKIESIIKKMWTFDLFKSEKFGDCPANSTKLVNKYLKNKIL